MDVTRRLGDDGGGIGLPGVDNLLLHCTPFAENWAKPPVIVSGEGYYVKDGVGQEYVEGLGGLFTTQVEDGRSELAEVAARQMKELGSRSPDGRLPRHDPGSPFGDRDLKLQGAFRAPATRFRARSQHPPRPGRGRRRDGEAVEFGPPETVAAVILEPVQNGGGCLVPPEGYW
jgi:adenosylmethionine-8-amino-7-oxononanoate aminotransferase